MIGSGGNINKIFKMSGRSEGNPISYIYLNAPISVFEKDEFTVSESLN